MALVIADVFSAKLQSHIILSIIFAVVVISSCTLVLVHALPPHRNLGGDNIEVVRDE